MIVKEVRGKDKLLIIHYYSQTKEDTAVITEQEYTVDPMVIHLILYDSSEKIVYSGDDAIARAEHRLGTGEGEYSLFFNNCEHFCTYVKTGKDESQQVQQFAKVVGTTAAIGLGFAFAGTLIYAIHKLSEPPKNPAGKPPNSQGGKNI